MVKHLRPRSGDGYGNIYTPHAGSMIIQVQREAGLANRTIILTPRQVALLRTLWSPMGRVLLLLLVGTWILFAIQTARVPLLSARVQELEQSNARLDTLQLALARLHKRYDQVRLLLSHAPGAAGAPAATLAPVADTAPARRPGDGAGAAAGIDAPR